MKPLDTAVAVLAGLVAKENITPDAQNVGAFVKKAIRGLSPRQRFEVSRSNDMTFMNALQRAIDQVRAST